MIKILLIFLISLFIFICGEKFYNYFGKNKEHYNWNKQNYNLMENIIYDGYPYYIKPFEYYSLLRKYQHPKIFNIE